MVILYEGLDPSLEERVSIFKTARDLIPLSDIRRFALDVYQKPNNEFLYFLAGTNYFFDGEGELIESHNYFHICSYIRDKEVDDFDYTTLVKEPGDPQL